MFDKDGINKFTIIVEDERDRIVLFSEIDNLDCAFITDTQQYISNFGTEFDFGHLAGPVVFDDQHFSHSVPIRRVGQGLNTHQSHVWPNCKVLLVIADCDATWATL